jgi:hypothetical protein
VQDCSQISRESQILISAPKMDAIKVLNSDLARQYTHIHPFLVFSGYFFYFASIVADPVSTLSTLAILLSAIQIAYVIICLPPAGSVSPKGSGTKKSSKPRTESTSLSSKITVSTRYGCNCTYIEIILIDINSQQSFPLLCPSFSGHHSYLPS